MTGEQAVGRPIHSVRSKGTSRLPFFRLAAAAVVAYTVFDVLWLVNGWGGERATLVFSDLSAVGCALVAAVACARTWRIEAPTRRRAWGLFAMAAG